MYTQSAIKIFDKVQATIRKLKQRRFSPSGSIQWVKLGGSYKIKAWYSGNYPAEYSNLNTIYVCDVCFSYFSHGPSQLRHMTKCPYWFAPPGDEVYRDKMNGISVFEVFGEVDPMYCSNLCRLSMLWLENKVVYIDVEPFVFYVLTSFSNGCFRPLGYFSKQKDFLTNNLCCFCVFPCYQSRGYGTFMIDFSYMLSRLAGVPSGPERPFSAHGSYVYRKYWCDKLIHLIYTKVLKTGWDNLHLRIEDLVKETGIQEVEVIEAITDLCSYEWASNKKTLTVHITSEAIMEIGKYIHQKNNESF
ncbi:MOZ/SAS family protein [Dictyocaulus viviparus]|uniref:Histone acetyltransferase n=1 Tax=Dictyocaulus viviparus TaxID=29172 RepID=A0A0D8XEL3_DICVI|nr:MOZ/SAS family protein [Dictyocaulus viviparus]